MEHLKQSQLHEDIIMMPTYNQPTYLNKDAFNQSPYGISPQALMPYTGGSQTPGAGAGAGAGAEGGVGAGYDPNDPFAGGGHPTNPYTGEAYPGGADGAAAGGGFNPWGMMAGGLFGGAAGQMFGGDPYSKAESTMGDIPGMLQKYFDPYLKAGQWALPQLYSQYGQLLNDPGSKMSQFGAGFQQSPGYQFQNKQSIDAANRAAAAGGMVGSPAEQQQVEKTSGQLANQDYYNYINHVMNLYQQGLGGTGNMAQMGFGAASGLGEDLAGIMESQAQMQAAQGQGKSNMWGGLGGALGTAAMYAAMMP